jgi:uncharacterized membrane protein
VTATPARFGHSPRTVSLVAYAGGWATGALVWLADDERADIRFHAVQSMLAFGTLTLAWVVCWGGSFLALLVSASAFFVLQRLALGVLALGVCLWLFCLWSVWRCRRLILPFVGRRAEAIAASRRLAS